MVDEDKDGKISLTELQAVLNTVGLVDFSKDKVANVFEYLDLNKSGYISLEAWVQALKKADTVSVLRACGIITDDVREEAAVRIQVSACLCTRTRKLSA